MFTKRTLAGLLLGTMLTAPALAQDNMEKLSNMQRTDATFTEILGENEYVASNPEKGKIRKHVTYFLMESPFTDIHLEEKGGLDDARWFKLADILELNFYHDILPIMVASLRGALRIGTSSPMTIMAEKPSISPKSWAKYQGIVIPPWELIAQPSGSTFSSSSHI